MNIDIQKWAPWNWFRNEEEQQRGACLPSHSQSRSPVPSLYGQHPLWELHREMDQLFERAFQGFHLPFGGSSAAAQSLLKPNVDIRENKKSYTISVEVPGVEEGDVKLELANGTLTISGEKKHEKEDKGELYHSIERSYGSFKRVLSLPQDAREDDIKATFKNGVLTVTVPRKHMEKPESGTKVIEINKAA
jgi:HSP20 family protein